MYKSVKTISMEKPRALVDKSTTLHCLYNPRSRFVQQSEVATQASLNKEKRRLTAPDLSVPSSVLNRAFIATPKPKRIKLCVNCGAEISPSHDKSLSKVVSDLKTNEENDFYGPFFKVLDYALDEIRETQKDLVSMHGIVKGLYAKTHY